MDGVLSVPAGETVALTTRRDARRLEPVSAHPLREGTAPDSGSILVSLAQESDGPDGPRMTMRIRNPFDDYLQLFANMQPATEDRFFPMPTCTVPPGSTGVHGWRYPTIQVTLWHFRLVPDAPSADICRTAGKSDTVR